MKNTWDLVIADMKARDKLGTARYGHPLRPFNGRNSLQDAYEEALDLCVYLKNAMLEQETKPPIVPPQDTKPRLKSEYELVKSGWAITYHDDVGFLFVKDNKELPASVVEANVNKTLKKDEARVLTRLYGKDCLA